jgi:hypothetical protein
MATPTSNDELRMLFVLYFEPCDLMYGHHLRLKPYFFSDPETQERIGKEFLIFTHYWFASLFVVAEGWKQLGFSEPEIDKMINQHWISLREFRNGVFHFQRKDAKLCGASREVGYILAFFAAFHGFHFGTNICNMASPLFMGLFRMVQNLPFVERARPAPI